MPKEKYSGEGQENTSDQAMEEECAPENLIPENA